MHHLNRLVCSSCCRGLDRSVSYTSRDSPAVDLLQPNKSTSPTISPQTSVGSMTSKPAVTSISMPSMRRRQGSTEADSGENAAMSSGDHASDSNSSPKVVDFRGLAREPSGAVQRDPSMTASSRAPGGLRAAVRAAAAKAEMMATAGLIGAHPQPVAAPKLRAMPTGLGGPSPSSVPVPTAAGLSKESSGGRVPRFGEAPTRTSPKPTPLVSSGSGRSLGAAGGLQPQRSPGSLTSPERGAAMGANKKFLERYGLNKMAVFGPE